MRRIAPGRMPLNHALWDTTDDRSWKTRYWTLDGYLHKLWQFKRVGISAVHLEDA